MSKDKKMNVNKIMQYIGYGVALAFAIVGIILVKNVVALNMLPLTKVAIVGLIVFVVAVAGYVAFLQRWKVSGLVSKIIAALMVVVMLVGNSYVVATLKGLKQITGGNTQVDTIAIYVKGDDSASDVMGVKGYNLGTIVDDNADAVSKATDKVKEMLASDISFTECSDLLDILIQLYNSDIDAMLISEAQYVNVENIDEIEEVDEEMGIDDLDAFKAFAKSIRKVWSEDIETEIIEETSEATTSTSENSTTGDEQPTTESAGTTDNKIFTLYLSGVDVYGSVKSSRNSDVNIIMVVNMNTHQVLMINTPRDYYVQIPAYKNNYDKLTHAGTKGIKASVATLEQLYDIHIDHYVKVNFTGFTNIIDAMGGINVYVDANFTSIDGIKFTKGYTMMNGKTALSFARERKHVAGGDVGRGKHQMAVLNSMISKLSSKEVLMNYTNVLNAVANSMVTDMTQEQIGEIVKMQLNDMQKFTSVNYSVGGKGQILKSYALGFKVYMMVPDEATVNQAKQFFRQIYANEVIKY